MRFNDGFDICTDTKSMQLFSIANNYYFSFFVPVCRLLLIMEVLTNTLRCILWEEVVKQSQSSVIYCLLIITSHAKQFITYSLSQKPFNKKKGFIVHFSGLTKNVIAQSDNHGNLWLSWK